MGGAVRSRVPRPLALAVALVLIPALGGTFAPPRVRAAADPPIVFLVAASAEAPALVVARLYQERHRGARVVVRAEASSRLARDILVGGERADVLLFADGRTMDELEGAELIDRASRRDYLENDLVVIGPEEGVEYLRSPAALAAPGVRAVALCDTLVPLGAYARAFLRAAGVWEAVSARAYAVTDARGALAAVETGAADYAVVYGSQVRNVKWVRVVWSVPPEAHPPIRYPLALLLRSSRRPPARAFYEFLLSEAAERVFAVHGFRVVNAVSPAPAVGAPRGAVERGATARDSARAATDTTAARADSGAGAPQ
jgi:molybdate transport system substrate-binding protein